VTKHLPAVFAAMALAAAGSALAANPPAQPITLNAKPGNVTFNHKTHVPLKCETCHAKPEGGKIGLTKDTAHALCKTCHTKQAKGPTKCADCHKKK